MMITCSHCGGTGEQKRNTSARLDPQCDETQPCRRCGATGALVIAAPALRVVA